MKRIFDAVATGLPFCIFKFCAGWIIFRNGNPVLGGAVVAWSAVDLLLNAAALAAPARFSVCLLSNIGRYAAGRRRGEELFLAFDTFLSFAIVGTVIGFRLIARLSDPWLSLWDFAVVLNVLGAGTLRLFRVAERVPPPQ